jgi:hypothetical protein
MWGYFESCFLGSYSDELEWRSIIARIRVCLDTRFLNLFMLRGFLKKLTE